ncbi:hypothetical protein BH11BAC3_BH11BAC3_07560 [soil metagenome]
MAHEVSYVELLLTERWRNKRAAIVERDKHQCRNCGSTFNLQVHHRQYHIDSNTGFKREPWNYDNRYLVTLCEHCHKAGHQQYKIPFFKN